MNKERIIKPTFNLVSPELPSGSAWLVNCLLELGVSAWNPWDVVIPNEWIRIADNQFRYNDPNNSWQQTLPSLRLGNTFDFDQKQSVFVSHRWPCTLPAARQHVLFVRDPRDMLYSHWRREKHNQADFNLSFSSFVDVQYHHYPLSYQEYLLLYLQLWMQAYDADKHLVVKFEDYRQDAFKTLHRTQSFLDLTVSTAKLKHAVLKSDFKVCQQVEQQLAATGNLQRKFNFSATACEYKKKHIESNQFELSPAFNDICAWLGYEATSPKKVTNERPLSEANKNQITAAIYHGSEQSVDSGLVDLLADCDLKHDWRFLT